MAVVEPNRLGAVPDVTVGRRSAAVAPAPGPAVGPLSADTLALTGPSTRAAAPAPLDVAALERRVSRETGTRPTEGNRVDLLIDGQKAYAAMLDLINHAQSSLSMEMFIFKGDQTSWDVAEALAAAAQRGVQVRLVTDWVGSPTAAPIYDFLRANGVETRHWVPKQADAPTQVDHRKVLVADGSRAITGGMNIADEYRHDWHDVMVVVEGPAVGDLQRQFVSTWKEVGGRPIADEAKLFPAAADTARGRTQMRVLTTQPQESIRQALFAAIDAAKQQINLEVPYFTDDALVAKLTAAAKRGVAVHVIVPAVSNHKIVDTASRHHFQPLLDAGVHVHLYAGRMSHTKAASIDGVWATVGSCNGDNLSLRVNREMNVTMADPAVVARLDRELFAQDQASSHPLLPKPMSWTDRLATWAARRLNFTL
jgi:cardiolipin synthase